MTAIALDPTQKVNVLDKELRHRRGKSFDVDDVDDDFIKSMASIACIPLPKKKKKNQIDDIFDWIWQNDVRLAEIDEPTFQTLEDVAHIDLPLPKFPPSTKAAVAEISMNWLRENSVKRTILLLRFWPN
jgi:hypothetical protein